MAVVKSISLCLKLCDAQSNRWPLCFRETPVTIQIVLIIHTAMLLSVLLAVLKNMFKKERE